MYNIDDRFLTQNSVSIIFPEGFRKAYVNSPSGRIELENEVPQEIHDEVLKTWGSTPTVPDPETSELEPQPTTTPTLTNLDLAETIINLHLQQQVQPTGFMSFTATTELEDEKPVLANEAMIKSYAQLLDSDLFYLSSNNRLAINNKYEVDIQYRDDVARFAIEHRNYFSKCFIEAYAYLVYDLQEIMIGDVPEQYREQVTQYYIDNYEQ